MSAPLNSKKVLIVAGEFPPIKTIGRIRTAKFTQHLRNYGWTPIILSIEPTAETYDSSLENEIATGIQVYRVPKPDIEKFLVNKIKKILGKTEKNKALHTSATITDLKLHPTNHENQGSSNKLFNACLNLFKNLLKYIIYLPDDYNVWAYNANKIADQICKEHNISIVYTSLPPFSACHIGYKIKKKHNIPWVVDYRDLWYGDVLREWIPLVRQKLELILEKFYMRQADVIISVSEQKTEYLKKLHPTTKARWETVTNGYDTEIFEPLLALPRKKDQYINFVYTGRLFKNRRGYAFAEALGQLCLEDFSLKDRVRVHILGGVSPEIKARYDEILTSYDIKLTYIFTGDIGYQQSMEAQVNADYLLLIVDTGITSDGVIPGKLFEYIASRRPIFALTDPGATQEIIEKANVGVVVPAESTEQCKIKLKAILQSNPPETIQVDEIYLQQFDRKKLSEKLADIFNNIRRLKE